MTTSLNLDSTTIFIIELDIFWKIFPYFVSEAKLHIEWKWQEAIGGGLYTPNISRTDIFTSLVRVGKFNFVIFVMFSLL